MSRKLLVGMHVVLFSCVPATDPDTHSANSSPSSATTNAAASASSASEPSSAAPASVSSMKAGAEEGDKNIADPIASVSVPAKPVKDSGPVLDSLSALKAAQAKGLKVSLLVPYPVHCPHIEAPKGDVGVFKAKGKLADLVIDMEAFVRTELGVPEVVAIFGEPVLCNDGAVPGYLNMHLAPRDPAIQQVTVETHDGDLIGLVVEYEKTVTIDIAALESRYGKSERTMAPLDSFEAGGDAFSFDGKAFQARYIFSHRKRSEPLNAREVYQYIFRRSSMIEILPDGFRSADDVARLIALALRPRPPEPVAFAGTLGIYSPPVNGRIAFGTAPPIRNISSAAVGLRDEGTRKFVTTLEATFQSPIAGDAQAFVRALGNRLGLAPPKVTDDGKRKQLEIADDKGGRGRILLDLGPSGLRAIEIIRADAK
ncbi:MAG TPA: hypothetical protein PK156_08360 [Polyangium sp.]|nr:hypothetical protein [Polyangium sp.]